MSMFLAPGTLYHLLTERMPPPEEMQEAFEETAIRDFLPAKLILVRAIALAAACHPISPGLVCSSR